MSHNGAAPAKARPGRGNPGAGGEIAAHGRPSRLRSIRIRLVLPVILATAGLVTLGVAQSRDALREAADGERARVLAQTSATAVALVHHVELEYSEINLLRQRGGQAGVQLLTAAQARTDASRTKFVDSARVSRAEEPDLGPALDEAAQALSLLPALRGAPTDSAAPSPELFDTYDTIVHELIGAADAVAGQLADPRLVEIARSVVLAAELEHLAAEQLDLLRGVFSRQKMAPGELVRLAHWEGAEHQQLEELERLPGPTAQRFEAVVTGPDVDAATDMRDKVLAADGAPASLQIDPDVWYVAQSGLLRRLRLLEIELSATMERTAFDIQSAAERRALATGALTVAVVALTLAGAAAIAVRTSRRLRRVRDAALALARTELPGAIDKVTAAGDVETVRGTLHDSAARIQSMLAPGSDEIGELTVAFSAVHRQALRLAADQALLRMEIEATFVALSRRGQTLVQRQIHLIDQFGRAEQDPGRLRRLFALDHLAARMRRNEENLLVLAGGEPGRRFQAPVPILDLVQAAAEETEDYARVEMTVAPPIAVMAHAVGDVVHLLAEILENATSFSPPTTKVRVTARQTVETLAITVFDEGIGMPAEKLAEANDRLAHPSALTSSLVGTMGLLVVARLAQRHGIEVQLSSTPGGGTAATVMVPERLLAPSHGDDQLRRARLRSAVPTIDMDQVSYQVIEPAYAGPPVPVYVTAMPAERPAVVTAGYPGAALPGGVSAGAAWSGGVSPAVGPSGVVLPGGVSAGAGGAGPPWPDLSDPASPGPGPGSDVPPNAIVGYTATGLPRRRAGAAVPRAALRGASPATPLAPAAAPGARPLNAGPSGAGPLGGPSGAGPSGAGSPAARQATAGLRPGPPDPDVARARLASLASGIAAATRRAPAPQPPS